MFASANGQILGGILIGGFFTFVIAKTYYDARDSKEERARKEQATREAICQDQERMRREQKREQS